MVSLPLDEVSAKVRTGGPIDDDDLLLPVWAGVLPLRPAAGPVWADGADQTAIGPPPYLTQPTRWTAP